MIPGQVQKFTLDGKLVGQFGTAGRKPGPVRLDPRALVRVGERTVDGRAAQLARAEVPAASGTSRADIVQITTVFARVGR